MPPQDSGRAPALAAALGGRGDRRWTLVAAACSVTGGATTGYLVRTVNLPLFFGTDPVPDDERENLLRVFYRVNAARVLLAGTAWWAIRRARSGRR